MKAMKLQKDDIDIRISKNRNKMAANVHQAALSISFQNKSIGEKVNHLDQDMEVNLHASGALPLPKKVV